MSRDILYKGRQLTVRYGKCEAVPSTINQSASVQALCKHCAALGPSTRQEAIDAVSVLSEAFWDLGDLVQNSYTLILKSSPHIRLLCWAVPG